MLSHFARCVLVCEWNYGEKIKKGIFEPVAAKEIFYKKLLLAGLFAIIELMVEGE